MLPQVDQPSVKQAMRDARLMVLWLTL